MFSTMYDENIKPDDGKALLTKVCISIFNSGIFFRIIQEYVYIH